MAMNMDLNAVIEQMETGDQDTALTALQSYNKEVNQHISIRADVLSVRDMKFFMNSYAS